MTDLDAIKKRLAAATPGPWQECGAHRGGCDCRMVFAPGADMHVATANTANGEGMPCPDEGQQAANAALIAHAPQDLAELIAEVEHLRRGNITVTERGEIRRHFPPDGTP